MPLALRTLTALLGLPLVVIGLLWCVLPELAASLEAFLPQVRKRSLLGNMLVERYYGTTKWIRNPMDDIDREKLEGFMVLFKRYGDQYGFDWLAVVAQAYQESGLDHNAQSRAGAVACSC